MVEVLFPRGKSWSRVVLHRDVSYWGGRYKAKGMIEQSTAASMVGGFFFWDRLTGK